MKIQNLIEIIYLVKKYTKSYAAPLYGKKIEDFKLVQEINSFRPDYVIINIGGEIQEILALF